MTFKIAIISTFLWLLLLATSCKKYPENKGIHLRSADRKIAGSHFLTLYTVDGVDSLSNLNQQTNVDVTTCEWGIGISYHYREFSGGLGGCLYSFSDDKKTLKLFSYRDYTTLPAPATFYNIFLETHTEWKILKLTGETSKKKPVLKITRQFNGKTYTMQFN